MGKWVNNEKQGYWEESDGIYDYKRNYKNNMLHGLEYVYMKSGILRYKICYHFQTGFLYEISYKRFKSGSIKSYNYSIFNRNIHMEEVI